MTLLRYTLLLALGQGLLVTPAAAQTAAAKATEKATEKAEEVKAETTKAADEVLGKGKAKAKKKANKAAKKAAKKAKKAKAKLKGKAKKAAEDANAAAKGAAAKGAAAQKAAAKEAEQKKILKPMNMMKFTMGVGLATISSHPSAPAGETANFDAKGHSQIGLAYDLGKDAFAGLHPFIYYNYVPIDIVVRSGVRTFRGVWHGHQLGLQVAYHLSPAHALTAGGGLTFTVAELNPSDLIKDKAPSQLVANQIGGHAAVGYEYAMLESFHLGAQFSATFGTIGYTSALFYSSFLL